MSDNLPYRAEYAKSGRAACKGCKEVIAQGTLRLAVMVQSSFFDGMQPNWFHSRCFFTRARPKSIDDIAHFQNLRWADQEELRKKIEAALCLPEPTTSKGKGKGKGSKRAAASESSSPNDIGDYIVEYAKSNRSKCKVCEEQIKKEELRISKKDYESESAKKYGPVDRWHHVDCFLRARVELGFFGSGTSLPGYHTLSPEDQKLLKGKIVVIENKVDVTDGSSPAKKPKVEDDALMKTMKEQNEKIFKLRDKLSGLPKKELVYLLEHNNQSVPEGVDRILDRLADIMNFGNISQCDKCHDGAIVFRSGLGYVCTGKTEWAKCEVATDKPKRSIFKVPEDLQSDYSFLAKYKCKIGDRAFKKSEAKPASSVSTSNGSGKAILPLSGLSFFVHKSTKDSSEVQKAIVGLGGNVVKKFNDQLAAVVSISAEATKKKPVKVIASASDADIAVISEDLFDVIEKSTPRDAIITAFKDKKLSLWGADISAKLPYDTVDGGKSVYKSNSASSGKSMYKSELGVQKLTLKGGLFVDPDSKLEKKAHVYRRKKEIFSVVLSITDVQSQRNSYYKLQVLEADKGNRYWLFRSWGRIGTTIGGNKTEEYGTIQDAIRMFESLFEEKTGNLWEMRDHFEKVPGKMMMLDVSHGHEDSNKKFTSDESSKLPKPIQDLITLIFDIEAMKKTMLEFELDLNKMPLGKLTQKQIMAAFSLLSELQNIRNSGGDRSKITAYTNRFYTLVPHDFGVDNPPLLDNDEIINQKIDMLNNLMDIEIAYKLLDSADSAEGSPIDAHYEKLNASISILENDSKEFTTIQKYVQNSHAATHQQYKLIIEQVFKIDRKGEAARYKKFKKLPNRMLLWHGSRVTNFAGILSQGLRIAPPEAPSTGYMFGKGVYFADSVSKSANYCMTSKKNSTGLLLLCEVALGNMHELTHADFVTKLPPGKHSTKGIGRTQPDPSEVETTPTDALVPLGKGVPQSNSKATSLLYNEYIVYDVNQVQIQYLVRMKFKY